MTPQTHREESGFATILVVIVIVLVATVIGVLTTVNTGQQKESRRSLLRSEQIAIADSAASRYLVALNTHFVTRNTNFQLTTNAFTNVNSPLRSYVTSGKIRLYTYTAGSSTLTPHPLNAGGRTCSARGLVKQSPEAKRREGASGLSWPVDDATVGTTRLVVEEDHTGRPCAYWEILRVDPNPLAGEDLPLSSFRHIGVVFRVWNGSDVTPRYVQTTLSRGSFSDYQLLTDEDLTFGSGVTLTGKVHSNNYARPASNPGVAIAGMANVTCTGNAVKVSARAGSIPNASPACRPRTPAKAIDLGAMTEAVREVDSLCLTDPAGARYRCYPASMGYRVVLGPTIQVSDPESGAVIDSITPGRRPLTLRFYSDRVYVRNGSQPPTSSVTIFAHSDDVSHIYIEGTTFGPPDGSDVVVGLLAQGDLVVNAVDYTSNNTPTAWRCDGGGNVKINAAMMSETGTLTVPHKWLSQIKQKPTPKCGTLTVNGAIATRTMPVLQLRWGGSAAGSNFGFQNRVLNWNSRLKRVVPPMYPATGPWEVGTWREANHDCLLVDIPQAGSECAL